MNRLIFVGSTLLAIQCAKGADASRLLAKEQINQAVVFYQEKFNNGLPFVGSEMSVELDSGETTGNHEIKMLAGFLYLQKDLPDLEDLLPLLEHSNMACRLFCWNCLNLIFKDLPAYSPYFPPGSELEQVAKVRAGIVRQIEINRGKSAAPDIEASPSQRDDS
jgi:hypothetical protein